MVKRIRRADVADAEAVRAIYAPFITDSATSFEAVVPDLAEMQRRLQAGGDQYPWLVFERDRTVLGYAYASMHRARKAYQWSAEVSVYIHSDAHRCGVGRALYTALFDLLRRQRFVNAFAGVTLPNASSVGLHESFGFVPVGVFKQIGFKFGQWHDVGWWHLRLREDPQPQSDPLPFVDLLQAADVTRLFDECARPARLGSD